MDADRRCSAAAADGQRGWRSEPHGDGRARAQVRACAYAQASPRRYAHGGQDSGVSVGRDSPRAQLQREHYSTARSPRIPVGQAVQVATSCALPHWGAVSAASTRDMPAKSTLWGKTLNAELRTRAAN